MLVVATFWPALTFDFVRWDDDIGVTQNPLLTESFGWAWWGHLFDSGQALRFKPLHWLWFRGIHGAWGFNPVAWHGGNLVLHAGAAVLFFGLLRGLLPAADSAAAVRRDLVVWMAAALWAVHPLRVEPVAWVTGSTYALTTCLLLLSFRCYLRAHAHPQAISRNWLAAAWLLAVGAYASYPVGATYGLWLLAVDAWWLRIGPGSGLLATGRRRLAWAGKHALFLLPAVATVALTAWTRFQTPGIFGDAPSLETVGIPIRILAALASTGYLAGCVLWPVNLTPNMPPMSVTPTVVLQWALLAAGVLGLLIAAWCRRTVRPGTALLCFGFAALSLPCLGLTERPTWPVDRYSYLVQLVLFGGVAAWLNGKMDTQPRRARWWLVVAAAGLVAGAVAARTQLAIWQDSGTLFAHMVAHPRFADSPRQQGHVYVLWGYAEAANSRPAHAAELLEKARKIYLAAIRSALDLNDHEEALKLMTHLEHHFGATAVTHREKGAWHLRLGHRDEAINELRLALALDAANARAQALLRQAEELPARNGISPGPVHPKSR